MSHFNCSSEQQFGHKEQMMSRALAANRPQLYHSLYQKELTKILRKSGPKICICIGIGIAKKNLLGWLMLGENKIDNG